MQLARITRAKTGRSQRRDAPAMPRLESDDADAAWSEGRQRYLEAIHIPAAVVVLDDGQPKLSASNRAFDRLTAEDPERRGMSGLVRVVRSFLVSARERHNLHWRQPGIGGRHFQVHLSRLPALGVHGARAMLSLIDRTAEVETERSLRTEMLHDSLTGLPNRLAFNEAIEAAIKEDDEQDSFAILAIDLNRFSRINECVGALAGDELIITVARRLISALRGTDMLARMGGDEFGVLLRLTDGPGDALNAAHRLLGTLAMPIRLSDLEIRIDCSIGCAPWSARSPTAGDLLRNAQVALKRAKASGRVEMYQGGEVNLARRRFSLETDLRRAIEQDELNLAFQPLIEFETGAVSGFEVLARWTHPDHGVVSPVEFISVAEDSGLIVPFGRWAIDATARTFAEWDAASGGKLPLRLCINISPVQLARDETITQAVMGSGLDGDRLTLELTESSIVADPERANRVLREFHDFGCKVAMDDFGTGYSSLAYLQKLPIDILKIDQSFVKDMIDNPDSVAIIRAILGLARALNMATTAEGVETAETAQMLGELGCTTGQGYYFAQPLTAAAALAYYRARNV